MIFRACLRMSEAVTKTLVPDLRFPEFRVAGEWGEKNLGELASFFKGKGLPKSAVTHNGKNLCIHYGELFTKYSEVIEKIKNRTDFDNGFLSKNNDVLMPTSDVTPNGLAKACCVKLDGVVLGGDILVIRVDKLEVNGEFLSRYIRFKEQKVLQLVTGSTVFHLYASAIEKLMIAIPHINEQQKIANCLSSLDELITTQAKKIESLKAHKKGLMQQLFPAEGETVPKLRFPEFRDAGEWNVSTMEGISSISSGGTPSRTKTDYWNGKTPWVTTTLIDFNTITLVNEYITEAGLQNSSAKIFPKNTILMAMYGQGKTRGKVAILGVQAAINQACAAITLKKGINTDFVFQNLAARYDEIRRISNQGGQENLSGTLIKKIPFTYPDAQTNEQQKIANCLSSLDELITTQAQKIESLKAHKKGLMQQLFPATNEVNG